MVSDAAVGRTELLAQWEAVFGLVPPRYLSIPLMTKTLVFQAQCKRAGGLASQTYRAFQHIASGKPVKDVLLKPTKVGAHYVRDWNGRTYYVAVVDGGLDMDGRLWSSISVIAKHITGTKWSGPRFFGLAKVRSTAA